VVLDIFLPKDENSGGPKGHAFVEFADDASVAMALEKLNGREFKGKSLIVTQPDDPSQRPPSPRNQFSNSGRSTFKKSKSKGSRRNVRAKKRGG